jgi:AcrR family transcriptional regulator
MVPPILATSDASAQRRDALLDAAARCFARAGFHRTTMQEVAQEAGMSPGNLYRYYPSKDALVAGLTGRDRAAVAEDFARLQTAEGDFLENFRELGRKHLEYQPQEKAKICVEIWAEAARNPAIAALNAEFDREIDGHFVSLFEAAKARGDIHPSVDTRAAASIIGKLGDGLFVRRAMAADFDARREIDEVFTVIAALLSGAISFPKSED